MFLKLTGALLRAALVMLMMATPSLLLPNVGAGTRQVVAAVALSCAILTFIEYSARCPSLVEFRYAKPFNRIRFLSLFLNIFLLSILCRGVTISSAASEFVTEVGALIGHVINFPFSPVRLIGLMLPPDATYAQVELLRAAAGLSYLNSLVMVAVFSIFMRIYNWPSHNGAFNVWLNMPNFDPTAAGDVVEHMIRDSRVNILLGLTLPFVTPMFAMLSAQLFEPYAMANFQTLIWTVAIWAFIPAGLIMRGIALARIADMLHRKRTSPVGKRRLAAA